MNCEFPEVFDDEVQSPLPLGDEGAPLVYDIDGGPVPMRRDELIDDEISGTPQFRRRSLRKSVQGCQSLPQIGSDCTQMGQI